MNIRRGYLEGEEKEILVGKIFYDGVKAVMCDSQGFDDRFVCYLCENGIDGKVVFVADGTKRVYILDRMCFLTAMILNGISPVSRDARAMINRLPNDI